VPLDTEQVKERFDEATGEVSNTRINNGRSAGSNSFGSFAKAAVVALPIVSGISLLLIGGHVLTGSLLPGVGLLVIGAGAAFTMYLGLPGIMALLISLTPILDKINYFSYDINKIKISSSFDISDAGKVKSSQQLMKELNQALSIINKYKEGRLSDAEALEQLKVIRIKIVNSSLRTSSVYVELLDIQNIKDEKLHLNRLMNILEGFHSQEIDSIEIYWEVIRMKRIILGEISKFMQKQLLNGDDKKRLHQLLRNFISEPFEPSLEINGNASSSIDFSGLNHRRAIMRRLIAPIYIWFNGETSIFNETVSRDALDYLNCRGTDLRKQDVVLQFFLHRFGTVEGVTRQLTEIDQMEKDDLHEIPLDVVGTIEEIGRLPIDYRQYIAESARANRIPERLLIYSIIVGSLHEREYPLGKMLDIAETREAIPRDLANKTRFFLPSSTLDYIPPSKLSSYIGGHMRGKTTLGMTKIRPNWVRRHNAWQRFGIDADKLSDGEITDLLLNPKYHFEASACMWRGAIDWVKRQQHEALTNETSLDVSDFDAEASEREVIAENPFFTRYIPLIKNDAEWLLAVFHPQSEWFFSQSIGPLVFSDNAKKRKTKQVHWDPFYIQKLIVLSGVLDDKPAEFTGIETPNDLEKLKDLVNSENSYLRNAAERTLKKLFNDINKSIQEDTLPDLTPQGSPDRGMAPSSDTFVATLPSGEQVLFVDGRAVLESMPSPIDKDVELSPTGENILLETLISAGIVATDI